MKYPILFCVLCSKVTVVLSFIISFRDVTSPFPIMFSETVTIKKTVMQISVVQGWVAALNFILSGWVRRLLK